MNRISLLGTLCVLVEEGTSDMKFTTVIPGAYLFKFFGTRNLPQPPKKKPFHSAKVKKKKRKKREREEETRETIKIRKY